MEQDSLLRTKYIDPEKLNAWTNIKDIAAGYGMTVVQNGNRNGGICMVNAINA